MASVYRMIMIAMVGVLLSGCGFEPLYATPNGSGSHPNLRQINVDTIISTGDAGEGNLAVQPILRSALEDRLLVGQLTSPDYDLRVEVTPRARRVGVQIDASVSRFNYQLFSRYQLVHRETGARITGRPSAIASFNQVTSQYSSLFSERTTVEKASTRLAEEIERDILFQFKDLMKQIEDRKNDKTPRPDDPPTFERDLEDRNFDPDFDPELIPGR
ncbi:MAG: hypothetical protein AAFR72_04390 [Pseudomonadota bacterium]